jgi:hypothetical protein
MSGFDASTVVADDDLDFDFSAFGGPQGTIPEPPRELVEAFNNYFRNAAEKAGLDVAELAELMVPEAPGEPPSSERMRALVKLSLDHPEANQQLDKARIEALVKLCQGTPSKEQITALPYRHQEAFFGWLTSKFARPSSTNGTSA